MGSAIIVASKSRIPKKNLVVIFAPGIIKPISCMGWLLEVEIFNNGLIKIASKYFFFVDLSQEGRDIYNLESINLFVLKGAQSFYV